MVIRNTAHKIYLLAKMRHSITQWAAITIYKAMILPLFDVGDIFMVGASGALTDRLRVLQNRALRIVYKLPRRTNTDEYLHRANLLTLKKRRALHLIQYARWLATYGENLDNRTAATRSRGKGRKKLFTITPRCERVRQSFLYRAERLWNMLPTEYHVETDNDKFKLLLRTALVKGEFDGTPVGRDELVPQV